MLTDINYRSEAEILTAGVFYLNTCTTTSIMM